MVETTDPKRFKELKDWLGAILRGPTKLWSQTVFAEAIKVSPQRLGKYLTGSTPPPQKLKAIAEFTGVKYEELRGLVDGVAIQSAADVLTVHGLPESREAAMVGAEWGKIRDKDVQKALSNLIDLIVASQEREKRKADRREKSHRGHRDTHSDGPSS